MKKTSKKQKNKKPKVFVGMSPKKPLRGSTGQAGVKSHSNKKLVFVGMSGGVDSSVAAYLLKKRGYDVVGVFIRSFNLDGCQERDALDARRVAEHIGIPFYTLDLEEEYKALVVDYMIDGYKKGITPNPDVMCNKEIKFGLFFNKAIEMGADYVATGHYAKKNKNGEIEQADDKNKDQTYFLWAVSREKLAKSLFPIGDYEKSEIRRIAKRVGLPTADKKDSQGICFLGKISFFDFLKKYIPEKIGDVLTTDGKKIGEHQGIYFYTIGQRHLGFNLNIKDSERGKFYVAKKDPKNNTLIVAEGSENEALYSQEINLANINLISKDLERKLRNKDGVSVWARVRYRQPLSLATLKKEGDTYALIFKRPQKFVASGQSAVLYNESGEMLAGGVIL